MKNNLIKIFLIIMVVFLFLISSVIPMVFGYDEGPLCSNNEENKIYEKFTSSSGPMDSPWPMQCHDNHHTGRSPYSTAANPGVEKWRFNCGRFGKVEGGIVIDNDDTLYFGDFDGILYAFFINGTEKWRYDTGRCITSAPAIAEDGTIYVGSWNCGLYALNPDGTLRWKFSSGNSITSSSAIAEDGTIYFGVMGPGYDKGRVFAINPDGTKKWHYDTDFWIVSYPAIGDDDTIYIGSGDAYLYAIYPNGTLRWRFKTGNEIHGHPSIANDGTIYIGSNDGFLYALNPNGTLKWKFNTVWGLNGNPSIDEDGVIYVGTNKLYAIYPDGTLKWSLDLGNDRSIVFSSPAISADGTIYVGTTIGYPYTHGGEILAVNLDGKEQWRKKISDNYGIMSSPAIGEDGTVYIGSQMQYEFEPDKWTSWGFLHAFGAVESNTPPDVPTITGTLNGEIKTEYVYWISATDLDKNPIYFYIDWGDGSNSGWIGQYASDENIWIKHTWSKPNTYTIRVKAKDEFGGESDWATIDVSMPKNKVLTNSLFLRFLEGFPILGEVLSRLINL